MRFRIALMAGASALALARPALAQNAPAGSDVTIDLDVVARALDQARTQIQPSLGATRYDFSRNALEAIPQGDNAGINQTLLRAPGVAQDSFGQIHVRGEHANVQYRINGVQLPEGLSVFGQVLENRFANSLSMITGALPAQYGFRTAAVVDIQTKTGISNPGAAIGMYGGSRTFLQPSFEVGQRIGRFDFFATGEYVHTNLGIENPANTFSALHDRSDQFRGLAYGSYILDPTSRISAIVASFNGSFQIPNRRGVMPDLGLSVFGTTDFASEKLHERQNEATQIGIVSFQKRLTDADLQVSAFTRYSTLKFSPDPTGDLLFNGIAQSAFRSNWATGLQADSSWRLNERHTLRAGLFAQGERSVSRTTSAVLPVDSSGAQTSDVPLSIIDNTNKIGWLYGAYVQDEWKITETLTLNFGGRLDAVNAFTNEAQVSPRINLVWKATPTTTFHAGYARYFVPPPLEAVANATIAKFANTTAAPATTLNDTVKAERSHYFEAGVSHSPLPGFVLAVNGYFKLAKNLIDEGQFGAPIILTAFNYEKAQVHGVEFAASYERGPVSVYANLAWSRAVGTRINSAQFNFDPGDLAYIAQHYIHLDHDVKWTGSVGGSYTFFQGTSHPLRITADVLASTGLRADGLVPNGRALSPHAVLNLGAVQKLNVGFGRGTEFRVDLLNITDSKYIIRDGTGVGVGAPQYGMRRTILAGFVHRF